ncbi:MAG TPA: SEC59/DGK1/VTE5 family protein [Bacteroidota bacterium]|nr:SEC59/DGK1/VTE5 family protein [Bacteroidota bacterium]
MPELSQGAEPRTVNDVLLREEFRREVIRKCIHLSSIAIPIFYFFTPRTTALVVSAALMVIALALDFGRHYYPPLFRVYHAIFGSLLRTHESDALVKRLNGGTYVLIAATLSIFIFPKLIAITSFLILIVSDLAAALVGRKFGRRKFLGKSIEGSAAFFVTAVLVIAATPKVGYEAGEYAVGAVAALAGTLVEASAGNIDDNLSVPLAVGLTLLAGYAFFLPSLDIYKFG